jgi:hypothetical protein
MYDLEQHDAFFYIPQPEHKKYWGGLVLLQKN